ncbi:hypothetical protein ABTZ93_20740 [Streptomyces sp. NPDC097941]|uniref:hypothetical protein n=1 Tax=Streptomyces sp. NPDC097941 TaxID=3155685 RepID=UPI0033205522
MTHPNPYRLTDPPADSPPADAPSGVSRGDVLRSVLWAVVVVSTVANMAASFGGARTWVHLLCGAVTVLGAGTLVVRNLRGHK